MVINRKQTGRALSLPMGLVVAALVSVAITALSSAILGKLIEIEKIQWENVGYGIIVILFLSSFWGSVTASKKIKRQHILVCILAGFVYFGILLLITALFFGGQYDAVGVTAAMVLAGSGCAILARGKVKGRKTLRKYKIRNR